MVDSCMHGCNVPSGKPACLYRQIFNSLPNDSILDQSKLKAFAEDNINVNKKLKFDSGRVEKRCEKERKRWLPAFSPFLTVSSTELFLKVVKRRDCVVMG